MRVEGLPFDAAVPHNIQVQALLHIRSINGPDCDMTEYGFFGLPELSDDEYVREEVNTYDQILRDLLPVEEDVARLNLNQADFDNAVQEPLRHESPRRLFFLDGPAGTGKTFLYNLLLKSCMRLHQVNISVASTGTAASLLLKGSTAHRAFKIPVTAPGQPIACGITLQSKTAKLIRECKLFLFDEISMSQNAIMASKKRIAS